MPICCRTGRPGPTRPPSPERVSSGEVSRAAVDVDEQVPQPVVQGSAVGRPEPLSRAPLDRAAVLGQWCGTGLETQARLVTGTRPNEVFGSDRDGAVECVRIVGIGIPEESGNAGQVLQAHL